jgi:hypothetical protein
MEIQQPAGNNNQGKLRRLWSSLTANVIRLDASYHKFLSTLSSPTRWVANQLRWAIALGLGLTMVRLDEYLVGVVLLFISSVILFFKAIHWSGVSSSSKITKLLRSVFLLLSILLAALLLAGTNTLRGTKPWSGVWSRWFSKDSGVQSKTNTMSLPLPFAVAVEVKLLVPGPAKDEAGTGFWSLSTFGPNCYLRSADVALFIRIKNLEQVKTIITAYSVSAYGGELNKIRMTDNQPVQMLEHGVIPRDFQGTRRIPIPVGSGNLNGGFVKVPFTGTDFSVAAHVSSDVLDQELADHYLQPGDTVRGWAFFEYPGSATIPAKLSIKISDDLGHTFSYDIPDEPGPSGDILTREVTASGPTMNLSSCIRLPHQVPNRPQPEPPPKTPPRRVNKPPASMNPCQPENHMGGRDEFVGCKDQDVLDWGDAYVDQLRKGLEARQRAESEIANKQRNREFPVDPVERQNQIDEARAKSNKDLCKTFVGLYPSLELYWKGLRMIINNGGPNQRLAETYYATKMPTADISEDVDALLEDFKRQRGTALHIMRRKNLGLFR